MLVLEELFYGLEVGAGIEVAKAQLPDGCHGAFLQAMEQIREIPVKVVVDLKRIRRFAQQYAPGATEHLHKSAVFQGKQAVDDREDGRFIAHPRYRRFNISSSLFCAVNRPENEKRPVPTVS